MLWKLLPVQGRVLSILFISNWVSLWQSTLNFDSNRPYTASGEPVTNICFVHLWYLFYLYTSEEKGLLVFYPLKITSSILQIDIGMLNHLNTALHVCSTFLYFLKKIIIASFWEVLVKIRYKPQPYTKRCLIRPIFLFV